MASPSGAVLVLALALGVAASVGAPGGAWLALGALACGSVYLVSKVAFLVERTRALDAAAAGARQEERSRAGELATAMARIDELESVIETMRRDVRAARGAADRAYGLARATGTSLRRELIGARVDAPRLAEIAVTGAEQPLLSIAIPGYNRPDELRECLDALVEQAVMYPGEVEVIITDDDSTDRRAPMLAHEFASHHPFVGFRRNERNLGLERNLIECARSCRGEYLWIFGNDDRLTPNGLGLVLDDLRPRRHDVVLFEKRRIDSGGSPCPPRRGSRPVELEPGDQREFASPFEVGRLSGLNSSFGWISQVVVRREPFLAIDPEPFFDLSLYPQLAMMMVAFGRSSVLYRNHEVVEHRTLTPEEKLGEAVGRREESWMAAGVERRARWFGLSYAAMLQRVVDRGTVVPEDFVGVRETLWTKRDMLDWIADNWRAGVREGVTHPAAVVRDAERFFEALEIPIPR